MVEPAVRPPETLSAVERRADLEIPVRGETVAASRYTPTDTDAPLPALLMYVPYHKDDFITFGGYDPLIRYLAASEYEVIVADMVGTGASTGHIDEMFTRREGKEPAAIVEWLADREWTTGRVGMFGKSYGGITSLDCAAQQPTALEAIVPIETPYQGYRNAYTHGGVFELLTIGMDWLLLMQMLDVKPPSRRDPAGRWADIWKDRLETVGERRPWLFQFLDNEAPLGDYWQDKTIPVERITVPTLAVGGWRDPYPRDTVEFFEAIDAPKRLLLGPWRHTMPHRGRESAIDFRPQVVEWFDHFLKDEENGALEWPTVTYWTERNGGGKPDEGVWRGVPSWPAVTDQSTETLEFALTPDGLRPASSFEQGRVDRSYEFDHTVGIESTNPYGTELEPLDSNGDDARSITFQTDPLDDAVECTGTGRATVRLVPSTTDPLVAVRVIDVSPRGNARYVTRGVIRPSLHRDLTAIDELVPGTEYEFDIPLRPKSHVFEPGHRIRVAISAAYFPENLPTRDHGSFTVRSSPDSPSLLSLPGRRLDSPTLESTVDMGTPDERLSPTPDSVSGSPPTWETSRNRTRDTASVRKTVDRTLDLPHARMSRSAEFRAQVAADDPTTATASNEMHVVIEYETETVEIETTNHISRDCTQLTTRVTLEGEQIFEQTWVR